MLGFTDEVQSVIQIRILLLIGSFAVVYLGAYAPNATWTKVRLAPGMVALWKIVAMIALLLVAIFARDVFSAPVSL